METVTGNIIEVTEVVTGNTTEVVETITARIDEGRYRKEVRSEWIEPYNYLATAPYGSEEYAASWKIARMKINADGTVAESLIVRGARWNERHIIIYS